MSATVLASVLAAWWGGALLLRNVPLLVRPGIGARVAPFLPGPTDVVTSPMAPWHPAILPRVVDGWRRALRRRDAVALRLERCHRGIDLAAHQRHDRRTAAASMALAVVLVLATGTGGWLGTAVVAGLPIVALVGRDLDLDRRCAAHQRQVAAELPGMAEHLSMLLGVGRSLSAALATLAAGHGAAARDLARVHDRHRQGLSLAEALAEWRTIVAVPEVDRLVGLLELERHGADLARLVEAEAGALRRRAHRARVAQLRRRAQMVWIPVTVAALVPGTIVLAIPFAEVLRTLAG